MISWLNEKRRKPYYSIIIFGFILFCSSAMADEISITPGFQLDTCNAVDTLWIYFDDEITGVEAASITLGYDASYFTMTDVINSAGLTSGQVYWTDDPANDSILITVAVLTGDFDGPGNFVGVVLSSDAEVSSTSITLIRTDLRNSLGQPISHTTSSGAAIQIDCTDPVVTCPSDITQDNDNGVCNAVVTFTPTATDNFTTTPSIVADPVSGSTFPVGTTPVEVIATDDAGHADTCTFDVIIEDDEVPVITSCPSDVNQTADTGVCEALVTVAALTATDNCGIATIVNDYNATSDASDTYPVGTTVVTWTVTDIHANFISTCQTSVTVTDDEAPVITSCPSDINQTADAGVCEASVTVAALTATDNCGIASIVNDYNGTSDASDTYPVGTTVVTWTVTDIHANFISTCQTSVTVTDDEAPVITSCPSDINQTADAGVCEASVTVAALTATDNCGIASIVNDYNGTSDASDTYPVGTTVVTWTVTDINANFISTCQTSITVTDDEVPVITSCPSDVNQTADAGVCEASVTVAALTATDNCGIASIVNDYNGTSDASDTYPVGTTVVTWTVTDIHANFISTCQTSVTVTDDEVPVITSCPSDVNQTADAGVCEASVTVAALTATDNCGIATIVNDYNGTSDASDTYPVGTTVVTWTVTDIHANFISTCQTSVTVTDDEVPTLSCVANQNRDANGGGGCNYTASGSEFDLTASNDNCGITNTTYELSGATTIAETSASTLAGIDFNAGVTTVIWRVYDAVNNTDDCTFTVTVTDNESPTISCPGDRTENVDAGCDFSIPDYTGLATGITDNCTASPTVTQSPTVGTVISGHGTIQTITLTATDAATNFSNCTFDVTLDDNIAPTISCPGDRTEDVDAGCDFSIPDYTGLATGITDNCTASPTVTQSPIAGTVISGHGTVQVITLTADDGNGNTTPCTFDVTLDDNIAPTLSCIGNQNRDADGGGGCNYTASGSEFDLIASDDNCGIANTTYELSGATIITETSNSTLTGVVFNPGLTIVTWRVYDTPNNTDNCTFTVTVADNEVPSIVCPADVPSAVCGQTHPSYTGEATATDNCDPDPVISYSDAIAGNVLTRTWTATDGSLNSNSCQQTITTNDYSPPTMQTIVEAEGEYYSTAPVFSVFGFEDDCDLNDGFYQIDGLGGSWTMVNNGLTRNYIYALAYKSAGLVFAGTFGGGIFRSMDDGGTWSPSNNGITSSSIRTFAINAAGDVFAGAPGGDVFRSTDNGDSWTLVDDGLASYDIYSLANNMAGDLYAGTGGGGVSRSTDNGDNWIPINNGLTTNNIMILAVNTAGDIFAGAWGGGVFRSTDNGDSWTQINNGLTNINVNALAINTANDVFAGTSSGGVFRSIDNGDNWTQVNNGLTNSNITVLAINAADRIFAGTLGGGVFCSIDNGDSWGQINYGLTHNDVWSLDVNSTDGVFAGTWGGGIFLSPDNGKSWNTLFTDASGTTWNDNGWTLPGFGGLSGGTHTVYFMANDDVNNVNGDGGELSWQFYKDVPPVIALNSPTNGETTFDYFMQLSASVYDDRPPMSVWIYGGTDSDPQTLLLADTNVSDGATLTFDWNAQRLTAGTGTMGLWHFDNYGGSTVNDSSGNDNHGSCSGDASWSWDGRFGYAVEFDGTGCGLSIPDHASLDIDSVEGAITMEAWIYPYSVDGGNYRTVISKRLGTSTNYQVSLDVYTGNLLFYSGHWPQVFISDIYISPNTWSYIAVTVDVTGGAGDAIFYLNGAPADTIADTVVFGVANDLPLLIGSIDGLDQSFDGRIDEVRLTDRALNASEIAANYELGTGDYYWRVVAEDSEDNIGTSSTRTFSVNDIDCVPGNANGDGVFNILDITYIINYLYKGGPAPVPYDRCSGDVNCDCSVNILDVTYIINYLYKGGPAPCTGIDWFNACVPQTN